VLASLPPRRPDEHGGAPLVLSSCCALCRLDAAISSSLNKARPSRLLSADAKISRRRRRRRPGRSAGRRCQRIRPTLVRASRAAAQRGLIAFRADRERVNKGAVPARPQDHLSLAVVVGSLASSRWAGRCRRAVAQEDGRPADNGRRRKSALELGVPVVADRRRRPAASSRAARLSDDKNKLHAKTLLAALACGPAERSQSRRRPLPVESGQRGPPRKWLRSYSAVKGNQCKCARWLARRAARAHTNAYKRRRANRWARSMNFRLKVESCTGRTSPPAGRPVCTRS
jgi:hypothetical protein